MNDFHRCLEAEIPHLRRYARALTRNATEADDLVQETLVRAVHKQHLSQPGTDLRAWLFTATTPPSTSKIVLGPSLRQPIRRPLVNFVNWSARSGSCPRNSVRSFCWSGSKA